MPDKPEYGPSWQDAAEALLDLREEFHVGTRLSLIPPVWLPHAQHLSSWVVALTVYSLAGGTPDLKSAQASFGPGGAYKTAPAAVALVCTKLYLFLEERREGAKRQAHF